MFAVFVYCFSVVYLCVCAFLLTWRINAFMNNLKSNRKQSWALGTWSTPLVQGCRAQICINILSRYRTSYSRRIISCSHGLAPPRPRWRQVPVYFSDNLQPIATRGRKARGTLLVDQHCGNGCSIKRAPLSVSYYNEISGDHIGRGVVRRKCSAGPVLPLWCRVLVFCGTPTPTLVLIVWHTDCVLKDDLR